MRVCKQRNYPQRYGIVDYMQLLACN